MPWLSEEKRYTTGEQSKRNGRHDFGPGQTNGEYRCVQVQPSTSKCCQEQTTNKLTAAALGGISPFLLNKRKLRSGNSFTREHNGDITAENKATAFFLFFW